MSAEDVAKKFAAAINHHNADEICQLMAKDHIFIDSGGDIYNDINRMKQMWIDYYKMFPDYKIDISEVLVSGDTVVLLGKASGTYTSDGTLRPENHWEGPAAWKAVVADEKVKLWQVFADNTTVVEIVKKGKKD